MAGAPVVVLDFFLGDTMRIDVEVAWADTGLPVDLSGARLTSAARRLPNGTAAWTKRNSINGGSDAQIYVTDPVGGLASVFATAAETALMLAGAYDWDLVGLLGGGAVTTLAFCQLHMRVRPTIGAVT